MSEPLEGPAGSVHLQVKLHESGPALWPEVMPLDRLQQAHRDVGTPIFETMYQGRRGGLAGVLISPEWIKHYPGIPLGTVTYCAVDPAISTKTQADETAVVVADIDPGRGVMYVRWVWHGRIGISDTEKVIYEAWRYYRPVAIGIEAVAYQAALSQMLSEHYPELPIEPVTPEKDKFSRFLALARLYEFGRVYHHPDLKGSAFEYQLTRLPGGKHDDMADAEAYIAQMAGIFGASIAVNERPPGFL